LADPLPMDRYRLICHRPRSDPQPRLGPGSIVMRKSASASSEVMGQITTEAWLSGITFDWTITAGRGFP